VLGLDLVLSVVFARNATDNSIHRYFYITSSHW